MNYFLLKKQFKSLSKIEFILNVKDFLEMKNNIDLKDFAIINISYPDEKNIKLNLINELNVKMWDIAKDISKYNAISKSEINEISDFILMNKDRKFIVISSSSTGRDYAIAFYIEFLLNNNDIDNSNLFLNKCKNKIYNKNYIVNEEIFNLLAS